MTCVSYQGLKSSPSLKLLRGTMGPSLLRGSHRGLRDTEPVLEFQSVLPHSWGGTDLQRFRSTLSARDHCAGRQGPVTEWGVLLHTTFREDHTISIANVTSVRTRVLQTENVNKNSYPFHSSKIPEKRFPFFISP